MKLVHILEMATPVGMHPEYSGSQVDQAIAWIKRNATSTPIEGSKFNILHKQGSFALERASDGEVLGWVMFDPKVQKYGQVVNPLVNIQILPQYRKTIAALMLINGVRQIADAPVYIDNPVFKNGQEFLAALAKRPSLANVKVIDKETGETKPYRPGDIKSDDSTAILIERAPIELSGKCYLPGGSVDVVYSVFEDYHHQLL